MNAATPGPRRTATFLQRGFTMVELMVGLTLGMIVLAAATMVFVSVSNNRHDSERVGRQIENGRFAVQVLADDLVNAGYYGELNPNDYFAKKPPPDDEYTIVPDPCSTNIADIKANQGQILMVHVQGFGPATAKPGCLADVKPNTSAIAVRRVATCIAGGANCDPITAGEVYFQSSLCKDELDVPGANYVNIYTVAAAPGPFSLKKRGCATAAAVRKYEVHIYFVANNNTASDGVPTLKRAELSGGAFTIVPLVEGIENLQVEYGLDSAPPWATPDVLTADPGSFGCAGAAKPIDCSTRNWTNVVTARLHVLSRTTEMATGQKDTKTFSLGTDEKGTPITVGPFNDKYKRHLYSQTVRMNNPAGRRE